MAGASVPKPGLGKPVWSLSSFFISATKDAVATADLLCAPCQFALCGTRTCCVRRLCVCVARFVTVGRSGVNQCQSQCCSSGQLDTLPLTVSSGSLRLIPACLRASSPLCLKHIILPIILRARLSPCFPPGGGGMVHWVASPSRSSPRHCLHLPIRARECV